MFDEAEQSLIVEMNLPESEVLLEICAHHAHRLPVLADDSRAVVVEIVREQGVAERCGEIPPRDVEFSENLRRGGLAEAVAPLEMVGEEVLLVEIRLLETGLEMNLQVDRTELVESERIETEFHVRVDAEVIDLISRKCISSRRVPFDIFLYLSVRPGIDIGRIEIGVLQFSGDIDILAETVV